MAKVQRIATLSITGAMRSMATDALDAHAGIPPAAILLNYICKQNTICMCTIPAPHPLHDIVKREYLKAHQRPTHASPIRLLLRSYKLNPNKIEKIGVRHRSLNYRRPFTTLISETREDSMELEKSNRAPIQIYSDGSGYEGGAGAAAVMYKGESAQPSHILRYHLGHLKDHSTYEMEIIGLILAVWLVKVHGKESVGNDNI
jgi:hypothetical protein